MRSAVRVLGRGRSSSCGLREWLKGDLVAEALELMDEAVGEGLAAIAQQQLVGPELLVRDAALKDVVRDDQDRVGGRDDGFLVTAPVLQSGVLAGEVRPFGSGGRARAIGERPRSHFEPLRVLPEKCLPADSLFPRQVPAQDGEAAASRPTHRTRLSQTCVQDRLSSRLGQW